jgi:hypothetical protein
MAGGAPKARQGHDRLDNSPALELFHATQAVEAEHLTLQPLLARQHKFARLKQKRQQVLGISRVAGGSAHPLNAMPLTRYAFVRFH